MRNTEKTETPTRKFKIEIDYKEKTKTLPRIIENAKNHSIDFIPGFLYITHVTGKQYFIRLETINGYTLEYNE